MNRADLVYAICHLLGLRPVPVNTTESHTEWEVLAK
jgi:hypothetical protein